jgi:eukaryotic-like serine/threonine-protein kinase
MSLAAGTRLGPYEILAPIGAGGMGEVYKARDTRLDRTVAVKILSDQIARREDLCTRFEREARAVASLHHPNICTLYDIGNQDGTAYMVMEFMEGETLAARIEQGALPLDQAIPIAVQIADALDRAHRAGVTHRDVKPQNIMLTRDGAKVLDFGLAKSSSKAGPADETVTKGLTAEGTLLGTPQYLAPEQFEGSEADARSDIWAFGAVLYEMVTGRKAFQGKSYASLAGAILSADPAPMTLKPFTPAWLERLVRRCLAKGPEDRWQSMRDVVIELQWPLAEPVAAGPAKASRWLWAVAAAGTVALGIALWSPWRADKPADRPLVRLDVDLGADASWPSTGDAYAGSDVAISPDGTRLAYASGAGTNTKLFIRRLDQPKAVELPGTLGARTPFFSPDGQWVGFATNYKNLFKISVEGGAAVQLGGITAFSGASWGADGALFVSGYGKGLLRIPAGGGPPETIAGLSDGEGALAPPQILPGGKAILFAAVARPPDIDTQTIEVLTLADRRRKILVRGGQSPRYLPTAGGTGHLVYINKASLFAIPFDPDKLETRGTAVPVLDDVASQPYFGGQFAFSPAPSGHGTLVYRRGRSAAVPRMMTLDWVDPSGKREPLPAKPGAYEFPRLSPDGKRVALDVVEERDADIWIYEPGRDGMTRLTFGGGIFRNPTWSPDGRYVVFEAIAKGIFQARADGGSQPQELTVSQSAQVPWSFTPDSERLAYFEGTGNPQIWTLPLEDQAGQLKAGKPQQFLKSSSNDFAPSFSPDGRWLAYTSNASGQAEVYVRAFPPPSSGQGGMWQISSGGGLWPTWRRKANDLVYESGGQIMAVSYTVQGDTFVAGKPRVWIAKLGPHAGWDLAPDGNRLLVLTPVESAEAPKPDHEVVFLINFFDELRRRAPTGK